MQQQHSFQNAIQQDHPYYKILSPSLNRINTIFQLQANDHPSNLQNSFPLKMYCRQNNQVKYATFIYFFTLPIPPHQYIAFLRNLQQQKQLDSYMDEFKIYKDFQLQNTELLYLSYKKVMIVSPRYFIYVRYYFNLDEDTYIIAMSDPNAEIVKDKVRGQIVLSVTRVHEVEGGCEVSVFSQTDMKMNLKFETAMQRGFAEIRKYLQKVYDALVMAKE